MNDLSQIKLVDEWDFPIDTCALHASSIQTDNIPVPQNMARAIVRTDTNEVLGCMALNTKPSSTMM